ncbi:MAG: GtrA family protein [Candidatus Aminicenantes bacterium]|jgi:putative flippase GtrA|nr:GtrA family protein [Candidatus Aminicenantes bacterium]
MKWVDKIKTYKVHILQFVKFNIVGIMNTAVDFAIFALLTVLGLHHMIAQVISYSCGIVNSYLWNKFWTFKQKREFSSAEALKFLIVNIISLGVSLVFLYIFRDRAGLSVLVSKLIATLFSLVVNFIGNKFWVFK